MWFIYNITELYIYSWYRHDICYFSIFFKLKTTVSTKKSTLNRSKNFRVKWMTKSRMAVRRMFSIHMHKHPPLAIATFIRRSRCIIPLAIMLCAQRAKGAACKWKLYIFGREYCREKKIARNTSRPFSIFMRFHAQCTSAGIQIRTHAYVVVRVHTRKVLSAESGFDLSIVRYIPTGIWGIASCYLYVFRKIIYN